MPGVNSVLSIGESGLFASQAAIEVTGNNIANVNTEGYSRQRVVFEEAIALDYAPGQLGTGVDAKEVIRLFDEFVEAQYNDKASLREKYEALYNNLQAVESLFNESSRPGISSELQQFFEDWQSLSTDPDNYPLRQVVIEDAQNLTAIVKETDADLYDMQRQVDDFIQSDVDTINGLATDIAELNRQIAQHLVEGRNNPNALYDARDQKVRELAEIIDINVVDNGASEFKIYTQAGQTVVDGLVTYSFKFENAQSFQNLTTTSQFDGQVYFEGQDDYEYTLKVVTAGTASNGAGAAQFKVSLDGGKTWLTDEDGNTQLYSARLSDQKVKVGDLEIYFGDSSDPTAPPANLNLSAGDEFTIVPKKGVYWYTTTGTKVNVTPLNSMNGQADDTRLTGGRLAGYFEFRDYDIGRYRDKLDAFTESVVWEVNRIHSQGAGLDTFATMTGTYEVALADKALGDNEAGLAFGDKLASGASTMYFYSAATGDLASNQSFGFLDFDAATPGVQLFNPDVHSLNDVVDAINNTFGTFVTATVANSRLNITANSGYAFALGSDTAGLYAALGLNTFFEGDSPYTLGVNGMVTSDSDYLNAGHVNGAGELNPGDNTTALSIAELQTKNVTIGTTLDRPTSQTLGQYYNSLVGVVGVDVENAEFNYEFQSALASELNDKQEEVSGVNLDEEMSNLIKFQHSYRAAAKLISTADEMFQTVLGLKN